MTGVQTCALPISAAHGKRLDTVLDVLKFFGTEEAQNIASSYGAAISAYLSLVFQFP